MRLLMRQIDDKEDRGGPGVGPGDWESLRAGLLRCALALTGRADEADELTQQTLVRMLGRAPDRAGHWGYAHRTMTRLWLDEQRSVRRRAARLRTLALMTVGFSTGKDAAQAQEEAALAASAVQALPPRQRAVLVLRVVQGMSYAQIGEAMECSVEAARVMLHEARKNVRTRMGVDR